MEKITTHTGIGVPLRQSNVDTDQIIPAVYLKRITRTGFEDALFAGWRKDAVLHPQPGTLLQRAPSWSPDLTSALDPPVNTPCGR